MLRLPKKDKEEWKRYGWNKGSVSSSFEEIFVLSLNYHTKNKKLKKQLLKIKDILNSKHSYLSFYYTPKKENPNCVQFFVLDESTNRLYAIENQL